VTHRNGTHIPSKVAWNCGDKRGVSATVSVETHDAFERIAHRHGLSKAALSKKLIEDVVARPGKIRAVIGRRA
jgi:hypothetical protein